jgi:hypothetical protein
MKEVSESDYILFEGLIKLNSMNMGQKNEMLRLVRTYIDEGASMCMTCDPQVVAMFKRLKNWFELYKSERGGRITAL